MLGEGSLLGDAYRLVSEFQTLLAGVIALVAALLTVRTMKQQIRQSDDHAADIRRRKSKAARAAMPGALSALCDYAEASAYVAVRLRRAVDGNEIGRMASEEMHSISAPAIPQDAITILRECIEFSDDEPAESITKLIRTLQVQHARLQGFAADCRGENSGSVIVITTPLNADNNVFDAAKLYASTESLFNYARAETDLAPSRLCQNDVLRALVIFHIHERDFPSVYEMISRRFERDNGAGSDE